MTDTKRLGALALGSDFSIPAEAVTQTFGILAVRGAGKSNAAVVMAEEMFRAGLHWVAIDPKGDWWGIRSSRDGKGPGLPVVIFGGRHGDVPLEKGSGKLIAEMVVERTLTCVLDVSEFTEGEKIQFLDGFADTLFRRKNSDQAPTHVFLEEADDYIPQRVRPNQAHLVYVFERLVKQGRARGLGATIITQRSAVVNKNVLTQIETLIALRTTSPQDRKAIEGWVEYHSAAKDVLESLSGLAKGEAWVWSPGWLQATRRMRFRQRDTYDSGATPAAVSGKAKRSPATLADVDLGALRDLMAATIERAKAEDPRELRRQLGERDRELAQLRKEKAAMPAVDPEALKAEYWRGWDSCRLRTLGELQDLAKLLKPAMQKIEDLTSFGFLVEELAKQPPAKPLPQATAPNPSKPVPVVAKPRPVESGSAPNLGKCERAILTVLVQHGAAEKGKLALLAGYSYSGGFRNSLSSLRAAGYITGGNEALMSVTPAGVDALGTTDPLPSGPELIEFWKSKFGKCERRIIAELSDPANRQAQLNGQMLATLAEYEYSGGFRNSLSVLRTAGVIEGVNGGPIRLAKELL